MVMRVIGKSFKSDLLVYERPKAAQRLVCPQERPMRLNRIWGLLGRVQAPFKPMCLEKGLKKPTFQRA
ncbi:MAG: hypothetical protein CTY31_00270 [Hyphomicrobium sp.]|nr:MAG: hypothetical protein CTY39_09545 [Hyphomicrobium sp.]PPD01271.1 MAG: hypothetical protein CTY31_00270 [Hyphomicrobium sp.]